METTFENLVQSKCPATKGKHNWWQTVLESGIQEWACHSCNSRIIRNAITNEIIFVSMKTEKTMASWRRA